MFFGCDVAAALYRVLPRRSATVVPCVCCRRSVFACVCLWLIKFVAELTKTVMGIVIDPVLFNIVYQEAIAELAAIQHAAIVVCSPYTMEAVYFVCTPRVI